MNNNPSDYTGLAIVTVTAEVARNVFSRVIVLLTALGYGITILDVRAHQINIAVMSFIYAISLVIAGASSNMKENYYTQDSTVFLAQVPNYICNIIFFVWIVMAFRKTLVALNNSN